MTGCFAYVMGSGDRHRMAREVANARRLPKTPRKSRAQRYEELNAQRVAHYYLPPKELDRLYPWQPPPPRASESWPQPFRWMARAARGLTVAVVSVVGVCIIAIVLNWLNDGGLLNFLGGGR